MHYILLLFVLLLASCNAGSEKDEATTIEDASADSTAIHLALVPGMDCLPFYVADGLHLDDSLGIPIRITTYMSGIDADTALMGRTVIAGYSDTQRASYHTRRGQWRGLRPLWQCDERYQLLASPKTRIRTLAHLKGKMIATERFAVSDFWIHEALKSAGIAYDKTYHPQIGDIALRTSMLIAGQIDAAMLPSPYAEWAISQGCRNLYTSPKGADRGAFYSRCNKSQENALHKLYAKASTLIQHPDTITKQCIDSIYTYIYGRNKVIE